MIKRILLSVAVLSALATSSWAQESGCSICGANYVDAVADDMACSQATEASDCESKNCGCASKKCGRASKTSRCALGTCGRTSKACGCSSGICGRASGTCDRATKKCGCASGIFDVGQSFFAPVDSGCCKKYKYARIFSGLGYVDDLPPVGGVDIDFDDGWGIGGALGRRNGRLRTELELGYRHNSFDVNFFGFPVANGNFSTTTGMANAMFDVLKIKKSTLYTGGGIGLIYGDFHQVTDGGAAIDDEAFAYQSIVGLDRNIGNDMRGFVEYRYLSADFDFGGSEDIDYDANNLFFGIEFRR